MDQQQEKEIRESIEKESKDRTLIIWSCTVCLLIFLPFVTVFHMGAIIFIIPIVLGSFILYTLVKIWFTPKTSGSAERPKSDYITRAVLSTASESLGIPPSKSSRSIIHKIRVSPGELDDLLDNISLDYDLPISPDDRNRIDTLDDIISLINSRSAAPAE